MSKKGGVALSNAPFLGLNEFRYRTDKPQENAILIAFERCPTAYVGTSSGEVYS